MAPVVDSWLYRGPQCVHSAADFFARHRDLGHGEVDAFFFEETAASFLQHTRPVTDILARPNGART